MQSSLDARILQTRTTIRIILVKFSQHTGSKHDDRSPDNTVITNINSHMHLSVLGQADGNWHSWKLTVPYIPMCANVIQRSLIQFILTESKTFYPHEKCRTYVNKTILVIHYVITIMGPQYFLLVPILFRCPQFC